MLLFRLGRRLYSTAVAAALALVYGFGTIAWYYAKSAFSEPLVTMLLLAALWALESRRFAAAGAAVGGMVLTRQMSLTFAIPLAAWAALRAHEEEDRRIWLVRLATFIGPALLGQLLTLGYNLCRFGQPFESGYGQVAWDTPLIVGLHGLLLSPGKGLLVFMPVLLLGLPGWLLLYGRDRTRATLILALGLFHLVPNALFRDWPGGGGWGPRLLLPMVPLVLLPTGEVVSRWQTTRVGRGLVVFLIALSVFIQVLGISVNWARHLQRVFDDSGTSREYFHRVHYRWADSPVLGQVQSLQEVLGLLLDRDSRAAIGALVDRTNESQLTDWQTNAVGLLSFNVLDFWFVYLLFLGVPWSWIAGAALFLSTLATIAAVRVRRLLRTPAGWGQPPEEGRPERAQGIQRLVT
jgi:hypothetical protein